MSNSEFNIYIECRYGTFSCVVDPNEEGYALKFINEFCSSECRVPKSMSVRVAVEDFDAEFAPLLAGEDIMRSTVSALEEIRDKIDLCCDSRVKTEHDPKTLAIGGQLGDKDPRNVRRKMRIMKINEFFEGKIFEFKRYLGN